MPSFTWQLFTSEANAYVVCTGEGIFFVAYCGNKRLIFFFSVFSTVVSVLPYFTRARREDPAWRCWLNILGASYKINTAVQSTAYYI